MQKIIIYADGASKGNPGPGGWGALVATESAVREFGGREIRTTNNRMELMGAIEALAYAGELPPSPITVHTDSFYVINGATKWVKGWQAKRWVTAQKKPVLNKDLWEKLVFVMSACRGEISWVHVGGHVGVAGNERVDQIATDFALGNTVHLYNGSRENYSVEVEDTSHDVAKHKQKSASSKHSRLEVYSYVSRVDGKVMVHRTWAECEARVRGKKARFKKATSEGEEAALIKEFSR